MFCEEYCESDSDDMPNTALFVGANGLGKTATLYALAHEMGFKVQEVNATAPCNGRQVLASLWERPQNPKTIVMSLSLELPKYPEVF